MGGLGFFSFSISPYGVSSPEKRRPFRRQGQLEYPTNPAFLTAEALRSLGLAIGNSPARPGTAQEREGWAGGGWSLCTVETAPALSLGARLFRGAGHGLRSMGTGMGLVQRAISGSETSTRPKCRVAGSSMSGLLCFW